MTQPLVITATAQTAQTDDALLSLFSAADLRRLTRLGQLALTATDRVWHQSLLQRRADVADVDGDIGLVVGTGLADMAETADFLTGLAQRGSRLCSPLAFQRSVHSALAGQLAILYQLTGYQLTVSQGSKSGLIALFQAVLALVGCRCAIVVCVVADEIEHTLAQMVAHHMLAPTQKSGAAAMVVETQASAKKRGAQILAYLNVEAFFMAVTDDGCTSSWRSVFAGLTSESDELPKWLERAGAGGGQ